MSLIGLEPDIQNSGETASSSVAHAATPDSLSRGFDLWASATNRNHAATMAAAPPRADQIASDQASAATLDIDVTRSTIARDTCPSAM